MSYYKFLEKRTVFLVQQVAVVVFPAIIIFIFVVVVAVA